VKGGQIVIKVLDSFPTWPHPGGRHARPYPSRLESPDRDLLRHLRGSNGGSEAHQPDHRKSPSVSPRIQ
jgi:hypothetical protein